MEIFPQSNTKLYLTHFLALFAGLIFGITAAYGIALLPLRFGNDLVAARELGVVSLTILEGYSKTRDIVNYMTLVILPPVFAMLFWFILIKKQAYDRLLRLFAREESDSRAANSYHLMAVFFVILVMSFNINYFYRPISDWVFPIEEGVGLSAASSVLDGGVQGLDFTTLYGPMLIYPLAMLMKFTGQTILADRIYTYILNIIAYVIVTLFFYRSIRSSKVFIGASLLYFFVFNPFLAVSANATHLRVASGFLPLLLGGFYVESKSLRHLWIGGIVAGQSFLFSQEVGICSLVTMTTMLIITNVPQKSLHAFVKEMLHFGGAFLVSISPMMIYFGYKGALGAFVFELMYYPKLYAMGFASLKFPSLATLVNGQINIHSSFPYWLILIYLLSALWLLPQLAMRKLDSRLFLPLSLLVMGVFLFRAAVGRSDLYHYSFVAQPAIMLFFIMLDHVLCSIRNFNKSKIISVSALIVFGAYFFLPYLSPDYRDDFLNDGLNFKDKFTFNKSGHQLMVKRTGGVPVADNLISSIQKMNDFLVNNTTSAEYVYFYPNGAGYYFLYERKNPTRYPISYQAITKEQRLEIIKDLEIKKPRFVIYNLDAWLIDNIPPNIQVRELHDYISSHYRLHENLGNVLVLKRINES